VQISRRDLFRSSAAIGAAAALSGSGSLAAEAVAGPVSRAASATTSASVLLKSAPDESGWRAVVTGPGEKHVVQTSLGVKAKKTRTKTRKPLLSFAQLSDVHICDAQSPQRLDYLDRGDDDNNDDGHIDGGGTYRSAWRPQEILGVHVADAMVRRINEIGSGPVLNKPLALTLQTGDNSDNNQRNEIRWNIDVLDGGTVQVDSGDLTKYEGVQDNDVAFYDPHYWHPDGTPEGLADDQARSRYGFPEVPGLLDAARAPFDAEGLSMPWYTAMGNHDGLVQGITAASNSTRSKAVGTQKTITPPASPSTARTVSADPDRAEITKKEWVEEHFATTGAPVGHGFTAENRTKGTAYYTFDKGLVRFIVLDTVNPNGRESGSIDKAQFAWLKALLAKSTRKLVILASHHTTTTMDNDLTGVVNDAPRVLGEKILPVLLANENVIAWVNGHTHTNHIWAHKRKGGGGFWEINTASHIDWPQQGRLIEIADNKDGTVSIFTTMIDHAGDTTFSGDLDNPVQLAALSRLLAANDWQEQESDRRGAKTARNAELIAKAPKFLRPKK
jgi:metallophosphoesterase (TIGR03767 family)